MQNEQSDRTVISKKITELNNQNDILHKYVGELFELNERLLGIGNRLNSVDHPNNKPQDPGTPISDKIGPGYGHDGFLLELTTLQDNKSIRLKDIGENLIPKMSENISYIERYI